MRDSEPPCLDNPQGTPQPSVGIIFLFEDRLWIDATPVANAIDYGHLKTHERGHDEYWQHLQNVGLVPGDVEYIDVSRGRVSADPRMGTFLLMLDRCILSRPELVKEIIRRMDLPPDTPALRDLHYRCPACMQGRNPLDE